LSSYFSGSWYDRARSGEGFQVVVFGSPASVSLTFFTYAADGSGRQVWLTGAGLVDDFSADVDLYKPEGGVMGSQNNPETVSNKLWGRATVGFGNCGTGAVILEPIEAGQLVGVYPIGRLTPPATEVANNCGAYSLQASDAGAPPFDVN
jgi:hypothetical protein